MYIRMYVRVMCATGPVALSFSFTFLNVVVTQSATIFELFPRKNKSLLIWRNSYGEGQPGPTRITRLQSDSGTRNETHFNPYLPCPGSSPLHSQ